MKKLIVKTVFSVTLTIFCHYIAFAQVSILGNFSVNQGNFVGWDNNVGFELSVRHDGFRPIIFSTNGNERMRVLRYGNIGIGTGTAEVRPKMMSFLDNSNASLLESTFFESVSIFGHNAFQTTEESTTDHVAIRGLCDGDNQPQGVPVVRNTAGDFIARFGVQNVGVEAYVGANPQNEEYVGRHGWGIRSLATDHQLSNMAVSGRAQPFPGLPNAYTVGIYGAVAGGTNMWAAYFEGPGFIPGGWWDPSDESLKENIEPMENAFDALTSLEPKSYTYSSGVYPNQYMPSGTQYGLIAQELELVLPQLVKEVSRPNSLDDPSDESIYTFKAVNYTRLIPFLIAGI